MKFLLVAILVLNFAHTLHRSFVTIFSSTAQFSVTIKPCGCWALPIHIGLPFWYVAYATFLFLGSGANASLELWVLFMLQ